MLQKTTNGNIGTGSNDTRRKKAANLIYCTNDYSMFITQTGNREKNSGHVKYLTKAIEDENLLHAQPICVNEKMEIIDGQHRFQAAKTLGLDVYYYIVDGLGIRQTQKLNSKLKNWTVEDYMHSFANDGHNNYIVYRKFYDENSDIIDHNLAQVLLGDYTTYSGGHGQMFKDGEFKIKDYAVALERMEKLRDIHQQLLVIKGVPQRRECMYALLAMFKDPKYNHNRMLQKLAIHPKDVLRVLNKRSEFLVELTKIYNYKAGLVESKSNLNARILLDELV